MKFTLDVAKWRCGGEYGAKRVSLGFGETALLNDAGYMCCLGQFSNQLGCSPMKLINIGEPVDLYGEYASPKQELDIFVKIVKGSVLQSIKNSELSVESMAINDNHRTTVKEKIDQLKKLFAKHGHEIEVINDHLLEKNHVGAAS